MLDHYATLEEGWDSYGAKAPIPAAIATARRLIAAYPDVYHVAPLPAGGMFIDWHGPSGEFSIDTYPDGTLEGYLLVRYRPDGSETCEEQGNGAITEADIPRLLERIR